MENLSIRVKLIGLVFMLIMITVAIGTFGIISTHEIIAHLEEDAHKEQELAHTLELADKATIEFKTQIQEWKNILIRGNNPVQFNKYKKRFHKQSQIVQDDLSKLEKKFSNNNLSLDEINNIRSLHLELKSKYDVALKQFNKDDENSGKYVDKLVKGVDRPVGKAFTKMAHHLSEEIDKVVEASEAYAAETETKTRNLDIAMIVGAALIGIILGILLIRSITRPINEIVGITERLAEGDMTVDIKVVGNSEISMLQRSLKTMVDKLRGVVGKVSASAGSVSVSADEISDGNLNLSSRTEQQAAALEETSSNMQSINERVQHNSDTAVKAVELAGSATSKAEEGLEVAKTAVAAINEIKSSSEQVADIIGVIDEIAFQTNLLALNASIEAERAGEQGRGFSVVANEVQKLAQRSADAANEIKGLIKNSTKKVDEGTEFVVNLSKALEDIVATSNETNELMQNISSISKEQATSLQEVSVAVKQLDETTQQNAALVEETSAASASMSEQAKILAELVAFFKLNNDSLGYAADEQKAANSTVVNQPVTKSVPEQPTYKKAAGHGESWEEF